MFQVRTLANQRVATSKRRTVAPMVKPPTRSRLCRRIVHPTWCLFVYMVALAMAGAGPILPAPTEAESLATLSHDYMLSSHWTWPGSTIFGPWRPARRLVSCLAPKVFHRHGEAWSDCLSHLHGEGCALVSGDHLPSGIIGQWPPPEPAGTPPAAQGGDRKTSTTFRDGTRLCGPWQHGRCDRQRDARCPNGEHRCAH